MPNTLVHIAFGALVVHALGYRGDRRAWLALVALLPDLDVVTAIPWMLAAPHLPWSAQALFAGADLLGHRAFSHSLVAAVLAGAVVWWWRREGRLALAAGGAWLSHTVLDAFTPWPTQPLLPFSRIELQRPLISTLDPVLTLVSALLVAALVAPLVLPRIERLSRATRDRWLDRAARARPPLLAAVLLAFPLVAAPVVLTAVATPASLDQVHPVVFPGTLVAVEGETAWTLETRWLPWVVSERETVPRVNLTGEAAGAQDLVPHAACTLSNLGPYATIDHVVWTVTPRNGTVHVRAVDVVKNATGAGGPAVTFVYVDGRLVRAFTGQADDEVGWTLAVPQPVLEVAACR